VKNRIHSILHERLISVPVPELFNPRGLAWLRELALDADGRAALDSELRILETLEQEVELLEDTLAQEAWGDEQVRLLMSLPGADFPIALMVLAALGDMQRFPRPQKAAQYLGLAPSTRQTGQHCYHGPITKQGNPHARWLLVQAAQHVGMHPGPLGVFFRRLAKHKDRNVAVVATARKLVVIAWHMLRNNEPYRYALPKTLEAKLARLRVRATGQRWRGRGPGNTPLGPIRPGTHPLGSFSGAGLRASGPACAATAGAGRTAPAGQAPLGPFPPRPTQIASGAARPPTELEGGQQPAVN
jgi:hypothetical protein